MSVRGGMLLHQSVHSSNLRSVGYDELGCVLEVAFHGGRLYRYDKVPAQVHAALMAAPSKGTFLAQFIKGQYPYRRV
ncbi:KTSC domain-containing protein [Streptomyces sp. NPDC046371]|uniref:KTSC domain-containing protein n=1 Tax=Streptomyces sp. NPDC046371 TaxID=3154916 RepID=UPI0034090801